MTIPIYRHNQHHDDWEVASVYDSDDCSSLGGSAYNQSLHGQLDDPALLLEGHAYDDTRFVNGYPAPQRQRQNYAPATPAHSGWDARYAPGKQGGFVVPPPGVIFPHKDWVHSPQDTYWPPTTPQAVPSSDVPGMGLIESPPLPPLLLSPSSPPRATSPLIKRSSPVTTTVHGQVPPTSATMAGTSSGAHINVNGSPAMLPPPPPRYHEVAPGIPPCLVDAECQVHSNMAISSPRRSGQDVLSPHLPGHALMPRAPRPREELVRHGSHLNYGLGDRPDIHSLPVPSEYEHEREHAREDGRARMARTQVRQRRPSVWQRFVRRFSPSHVSVGHT